MVLQLTKDEIKITKFGGFEVPIPPVLLNPSTRLDPKLAQRVFSEVPSAWYDELSAYLEGPEGMKDENKDFYRQSFLGRKRPTIIEEFGEKTLDTVPWKDRVHTDERGFATSLMINRNSGGSLYYTEGDRCCEKGIDLDGEDNIFFRLSREKISQLIHGKSGKYGELRVYAHHNVDYLPGAFFLRDWALRYINAAMASLP